MSVNRVLLIGLLGERRRRATGFRELVVMTSARGGGVTRSWERHRVWLDERLDERTRGLEVGQPVCVQGRLAWPARGHAVVVAEEVWPVGAPPSLVNRSGQPVGTHASPRPHDRVGHVRRVGRGEDVRLVWVRATRVGPTGPEE